MVVWPRRGRTARAQRAHRSNSIDPKGKVAIVTGASRGVGAAVAVALAAEGCRVACVASELSPLNIAVNCFRIDIAVVTEGFIANTPGADRTGWEPPEVAAEGILWMLRQPMPYSGRRESMYHLAKREGIMRSRAGRVDREPPRTEFFNGLWLDTTPSIFREPR